MSFLRAKHMIWTAKEVSARTGISPATVTKWLDRESVPSGEHLTVLGIVYGLDFLVEIYAEVPELGDALRRAHRDALAEQLRQADEETERLLVSARRRA